MRCSSVLLFFALAWPARANALPPVASDVVVASDGSKSRGRILELVENDHVSLKKHNGEVVRVAWSDIRHIEHEGVPLPLPGPLVNVHLEADSDVALERFDPYTRERKLVCFAPCDRDLPSGLVYVVRGDSIRASRPFELREQPGGKVWLEPGGASKNAFTGGVVLLSVGGLVTFVGMLGMLSSALVWDEREAEARAKTSSYFVGGGAAGAALGALLMITNASSSVRQGETPTRTPTWTKPAVPQDTPAAFHAPLASFRF